MHHELPFWAILSSIHKYEIGCLFPIFKPLNQIFEVKNSKHDAFLAHKQVYDYLQR